MHYRLLDEQNGRRTYAVVMETGDQVISTLTAIAEELNLAGSSVSAIGGFQHARLGYFDAADSGFVENEVDEQVEVLSFQGSVAEDVDFSPHLHIHVVLGRRDATTRGGHLIEATVRPTLEVIIVESPEHLHRRKDEKSGLVLLKP
jgi:predicted DNA-binding protein with PD1-like motif